MGSSGGRQRCVGVYSGYYTSRLGIFLQGLLILSLCGVPFLGVFFTKHALFSEVFYIYGLGFGLLVRLCLLISYVYSFRFVMMLTAGSGGLSRGYVSYFVLIVFLGLFGRVFN